MRYHKFDYLLILIATTAILLCLFMEREPVTPYFIILSIGAVVLLRVLIALVQRIPDAANQQLDHDLQSSLMDHRLNNPEISPRVVTPLASNRYKEPEYQSRVAVTITENYKDTVAKYN